MRTATPHRAPANSRASPSATALALAGARGLAACAGMPYDLGAIASEVNRHGGLPERTWPAALEVFMNFDFSDDQKVLRDQARKFLAEHASSARVRRILDTDAPYDAALWQGMG